MQGVPGVSERHAPRRPVGVPHRGAPGTIGSGSRSGRGRRDRMRVPRGPAGQQHLAGGVAAGRAAGHLVGRDREPLLLIRIAGGGTCRVRDPVRSRRGHRGGGREHHDDPRRQLQQGPRQEPAGQRAIPGDLHVNGDHRRERRQAVRRLTRGPGRIRPPQPAAHRCGTAERSARRRDRPVQGQPPRGRQRRRTGIRGARDRAGRGQPSADDARRSGPARAVVPRGRHGHRGQQLTTHRRRVGHPVDLGGVRQPDRARAPGRLPRLGVRRLRAGRDGHRSDQRGPEAARPVRSHHGRHRSGRAERGVRLTGPRVPAGAATSRSRSSTSTAVRSRSAIRSA